MAKGDSKKAKNMITEEQSRSNAQIGSLYDTMAGERSDVYNRGVDTRNEIMAGARGLLGNPVDSTAAANLRSLYQQPGKLSGLEMKTAEEMYGPGAVGSDGGGGGGGGEGGGGGVAGAPAKGRWDDILGAWQNAAGTGLVNVGKLESSIPGFTEIGNTGGYDDATKNRISGLIGNLKGIGDTGGFDPTQLSQIRGDIQGVRDIGKTGGFTPGGEAQIRSVIDRFSAFGDNGGLDAEAIARARGNGVFDEFARTGGYSDSDIANLRARATSNVPALYARENEKLNRLAAISGSSPALAASRARMIRGTGQSLADATRNAEVDLQSQIRSGRMAGAESLSGAELGLQNLIQQGKVAGLTGAGTLGLNLESELASNRLAGLQGAAGLTTNLENAIVANKLAGTQGALTGENTMAQNIAGNRLAGLKGVTDTYGQSEGLQQQGKIAGLQGWQGTLANQAQEEAAAAAAGAARYAADQMSAAQRYGFDLENQQFYSKLGSDNEQFLAGLGQSGQLGALGALGSLYGTAPGEMGQYTTGMGNLAGMQSQSNQGLINQQLNLANQPGWFDKVMQGVNAGAGLMTAFAGVPQARKPSAQPVGV